MKKFLSMVFALTMILSVVFIGDSISSNGPLSANAQTMTVKRTSRNIAGKSYRGGKWVVKKVWYKGKWVGRKVWVASNKAANKSVKVTKSTYRWTKRGTKKVFRKVKRAVT